MLALRAPCARLSPSLRAPCIRPAGWRPFQQQPQQTGRSAFPPTQRWLSMSSHSARDAERTRGPTEQVKIPLPGKAVSERSLAPGATTASASSHKSSTHGAKATLERRENIYTIPNLLTLSRIAACPFLGYFIVNGNFVAATGLLVYAGATDWIDGYLARNWNMGSVFGSILDPAADKALMTTLVIALAVRGLLPVPLAVLILGRDVALSLSAFYFRYISLPEPKTFARYWDFSIPSAEVKPTQISKYNTFLQLLLMGFTTISPLLPYNVHLPLKALQAIVAGTTIWSGISYIGTGKGLRILNQAAKEGKK